MYKRKNIKVMMIGCVVLFLVAIIALVYAGFTKQLRVVGGAVTRTSNWDIYFTNLSTISTHQTAKVLDQPVISQNDNTTIEDYSVSLTSPGDYITFTFDVFNDGNYDAKISSVSLSSPTCSGTDSVSSSNVCSHIHYYLTYTDGSSVQTNDNLLIKERKTMQVKLEYDNTVTASELASADVTITNLDITINYVQDSAAGVNEQGEVVDDYDFYHIGDKITLNNEDYYVIANSGAGLDYVTALKANSLTVAELNLYGGVGTENSHVNRYTQYSVGTAVIEYRQPVMAYYSSETCGYINGNLVTTGCTVDYNNSDIKYVVDAWASDKFQNNELKLVDGYKGRLITYDELRNNLNCVGSCRYSPYGWTNTPNYYWFIFGSVDPDLAVNTGRKGYSLFSVRPVINVYKSAISQNN